MNVKEYIQSGVVESYVLGLATDAERKEFEQLCGEHNEIAAARDAFERSLEERLMQDAIEPPSFIKDKVFEAIRPAITSNAIEDEVYETPVRRMNAWKWLAAASFILLAGAGYWAYTTNNKYNDLLAKQTSIEKQLQESTAQLQILQEDADILRHPMRTVSLNGTDKAPQAQTTVYWDTTGTKDVYMVVNNLPQPPSEKQYQLWALLDGKPIDLGVFTYELQPKRLVVKMKNVQNAQAFAITLENKGGSAMPEGDMYVVGNL